MLSPKKTTLAFALSAATALLFTACGGGVNDSPSASGPSTNTPAPDPSKNGAISLHGIVYGAADTSVPSAPRRSRNGDSSSVLSIGWNPPGYHSMNMDSRCWTRGTSRKSIQ